jgi:hypothetical protein
MTRLEKFVVLLLSWMLLSCALIAYRLPAAQPTVGYLVKQEQFHDYWICYYTDSSNTTWQIRSYSPCTKFYTK